MNLVCIPYHDWRKIEMEGARTRDAHLMSHLGENPSIDRLIVLNRPITYTEMVLKRRNRRLNGEVVFSKGSGSLYKVSEKTYVVDFLSSDIVSPIFKKKLWFFDGFGSKEFINFFYECLKYLEVEDYSIFSQNIFACNFVENISGALCIFDAWDNFLQFPDNKPIMNELERAYQIFGNLAQSWTTNSQKNLTFFESYIKSKRCRLVTNGVDIDIFRANYDIPADLLEIPQPRIGFGGKISHLFDYELFNYCTDRHPDKNFVIVGQILDKSVFSKIILRKNVFYLGDKHYSKYPAYVRNFNIGIIPYVTNHLESGANTIKVYEYLASNLKAVGTGSAGMKNLREYMYVAEGQEQFSDFIETALHDDTVIDLPHEHSWASKADQIIDMFLNRVAN